MRFRLTLLLLPVCLLKAGTSDVALFGTILDPSGAVVPNALVVVFNDDNGVRRSTASDQEGFYAVAALAPGHYKILVRKDGFLTAARAGLSLGAQRNARCDFVLRVGPVEQTVTVEGNPVRPEGADPRPPGTILGEDLLEHAPIGGRSLAGVLDLVPGIMATPANTGEAGQFSASGQRPNTNSFTVDGVSANTGVSGAGIPGQFPGGTLPALTAIGSLHDLASLDAIDAVEVQSSSFAADSGRMAGAQVAISTRSGTNALHGALSDAFHNAKLNANDWFANAASLPRPAMRANDFAAALGGPIRRNRLFFFASYEQLEVRQPLVWWTPVPSLASRASASPLVSPLLSAFPLPNGPDLGRGLAELRIGTTRPAQAYVGSVRVDYALSSRANLFARYSDSPSWSEFGYSQVDRSDFHQSSLTAGVTATLSPTITNDLRVNGTMATVESNWTSTYAGGAGALDLSAWAAPGTSFESLSINGVGSLNTGDAGRNSQDAFEAVDSISWLRGRHRFRMGADYQFLDPRRAGPGVSLSLNFTSLPSIANGVPGTVTYAQSSAASTLLENAALFVQDTWTPLPRLIVNLGVRWALAPAPVASAAHPEYLESPATPLSGGRIWRDSYLNAGPRVGLAWRMTEDARSVLRAGFGVFYDTSFAVATDDINGAPYNSWQLGTPYGGAPITSGPEMRYGFANDLRLPLALEWNFGWQHSWAGRGASSISYVGSRGDRLLRREGQIAPLPNVAELELATSHGSSKYEGLQAEYRQRLVHGLAGIFSYTWSHSIDNGSWDSPVYLVQQGLTAADDRADSNFDVRHYFAGALNYSFRRWTLDGAFRARSGFPIDVLTAETYDGLNFANVERPDLVAGVPLWMGRSLNAAAFAVPANRLLGNLGRNAIRGFGMSQLDLALHRTFALGDRAGLDIRGEFMNALNHPNFADPERYLSSPLFGQSTSMLNLMLGSGTPRSGLTPAFQPGGPRMIQIGVRVSF